MTGIIDGVPPGFAVDEAELMYQLSRRRPGQSDFTTSRREEDLPEILSGIQDGKTTGQPIAFIIRNKDQRPSDYDSLTEGYRPSHADFTYEKKYGSHAASGGGRASARETVSWVFAGAIAQQILSQRHITILSWVQAIGPLVAGPIMPEHLSQVDANQLRCPDAAVSALMQDYIQKMQADGDTCGGAIRCRIAGLPVGLGEPIFDKFHARLAAAMMGINACRAFELGDGMQISAGLGSNYNDSFVRKDDRIQTVTNHSAGIQGGITNGMPVIFNCYFKPVSSIKKPQQTVDRDGKPTEIKVEGRHDPCVVPRAVPIVDALAAMVTLDFLLLQESRNI